jgi:cyclic beta-1,2-glucan synthetase
LPEKKGFVDLCGHHGPWAIKKDFAFHSKNSFSSRRAINCLHKIFVAPNKHNAVAFKSGALFALLFRLPCMGPRMTLTVAPEAAPTSDVFIDPHGIAPLRAETFGLERLEAYARYLASASHVSTSPKLRRPLLRRLRENSEFLQATNRQIGESNQRQEPLSPGEEWLLDNFFIIEEVLREVRQDLPYRYYTELPLLAEGPLQGYPRILGLAFGLIAHTDSSLDENEVLGFVRAYQEIAPLTIGELWAVPTMLRLGLIENLRRLAAELIQTRTDHQCGHDWARAHLARQMPAGAPLEGPSRFTDSCVVALLQTLRDQKNAGPAVEWLEAKLASQNLTVAEVLRREHQRQATNQVSIGNAVTSLRLLGALDWSQFFERASLVENLLRQDPAGAYGRQDFATRDRCRRELEQLARGARLAEQEVARRLLRSSENQRASRARHVGFALIGEGRQAFERSIGYRPKWGDAFLAFLLRHPAKLYFGALLILTGLLTIGPLFLFELGGWGALVLAALVLPASEVAVQIVHFSITRLLPPRPLPKFDFSKGIPPECATFVVIPGLLANSKSATKLLERLELHYLANPDPELRFALLTDWSDADQEMLAGNEEMVTAALESVKKLNERHAGNGPDKFFLFHRKRLWNASESRWMGWERKRGKLQEFNRLLRGDRTTTFAFCSVSVERVPRVRFVLTMDADAVLPRDVARRLISTLAHPLNQAEFDPSRRRVVAGYGLLQPRVSFLFQAGQGSRFARIFAGSAGIDPYSSAVSDIYQDLFGEGSYTGKGLYDVDAFEAATEPAFPENHILSHDLIESNLARCGLVTDIEVLDGFPARYHAYARREHRWVRGDWQLLPWLGLHVPSRRPPGKIRNPLPLLARWKVLDNLRRSLVPPALLALLVLGWKVLPGPAWLWSLLGLLVVSLPLLLQGSGALVAVLRGGSIKGALRGLRDGIPATAGQVGLAAIFLADQARLMVHAICITLFRLWVSRRRLLEWETAAATEKRLGSGLGPFVVTMWPALALALLIGVLVALVRSAALPAALPFLIAWCLSPLVAYWVSQPTRHGPEGLSPVDSRAFRRTARKTWRFFETYIGPEDHWLPPDNFQEDLGGRVAHRTSPTNKGLLLLSTLAAHDFGYFSLVALAKRLEETFATLDKLQRHHGHFLNWYDTRTLQPLQPAYVSTVDSGNLLGCLLTLKHGLAEKLREALPSGAAWNGLADTFYLVTEELRKRRASGSPASGTASYEEALREFGAELAASPLGRLSSWLQRLGRLENLSQSLRIGLKNMAQQSPEIGHWVERLAAQAADLRSELEALAPWLHELPLDAAFLQAIGDNAPEFVQSLDAPIQLESWPRRRAALLDGLAAVENPPDGPLEERIARLDKAIRKSAAGELANRLRDLARRAEGFAAQMDFRFLYNPDRDLFSIGFNLPLGRLDAAHYDLLASEACLASFLAVARGQAPRKHWFQLGRPITKTAGREGLLSWGGTMFEYLMPRLVLPHFPGTLLDAAQLTAVARQQEYGRQNRIPWGISESSFAVRDIAQDYQYQSFGVPGLGIKRGLGQDLVVAPYATLLATAVDADAARQNLDALTTHGAEGPLGFYEAIDFTRARLLPGEVHEVVRSYMAHHQGMALIALANCVLGNRMPRRLRAEPSVRATEMLLQERIPLDAPLVQPNQHEDTPRSDSTMGDYAMSRRITTPHSPGPRAHLLSGGEYTVMVTAAGGGFSNCRGLAVTRWREDRTLDAAGQFFYIRDLRSGQFWSAAYQPVRTEPDQYEAIFSVDKAEYRRTDGTIETHLEIAVSPEKRVETRRLTLTNHGAQPRDLDVTSYAEIVLGPRSADLAHQAFQKLFLETEWLPRQSALLCRRRPRSSEESPIWAVHVLALDRGEVDPPQFETDRARFLGRRRNAACPAALDRGASLSGTVGSVLDPVFSLRQRIRLEPGTSAVVTFSTAVALNRDEALALADEFHAYHSVIRAFELAWAQCRVELRHQNLAAEDVYLFQRLAGHLLFAGPALRADAAILAANKEGQSGLWRLGISGDNPIAVVRVGDGQNLTVAKLLLGAHSFWRGKGLTVDLVFLDENPASYLEEAHELLLGLVRNSDAHSLMDKPGGVFVRKASVISTDDHTLVLACARVVLASDQVPLAHQVDVLERRFPVLPALPAGNVRPGPESPPASGDADWQFANGLGGFSADGKEYVLAAGAVPPAPWINVVANRNVGFLISDSGAGYTWAKNSQQNRLTPWNNDPIADSPGEVIYLRDEETKAVWSPTPLPVAGASPTRVHHAPGFSHFEQRKDGLEQQLRLFVAPEDPVKFTVLRIRNSGTRPRKLSATFYAEWVLGTTREPNAMYVVTEMDEHDGVFLARNAYNADFAPAIAFADVSRRPRTFTGDRTEFLGRNGSLGDPAALRRTELSGRVGAGLDPCVALQTKFDLAPNEEIILVFLLGQAPTRADARELASRYHELAAVEEAFRADQARWESLFSPVQIRTPDRAFDLLLNRWLLTQVLACRVWGRSAFYQSSGAYGFRDQLQDVASLVYAAPAEARAHLLRAAAQQFEEGDVLHWWNPPICRGVRTRFSDDFLWLPFIVHHYVEKTGDFSVLDEQVSFLKAPVLTPEQEEVYGLPAVSEHKASLYDHCLRSLENGWKLGVHGIPLMGTGDWNDGMNRVGWQGRGESVWVGWFQLTCLRRFAEVVEQRGDAGMAQVFRDRADQLCSAIEEHAWDGAWYKRAWFDDGNPLGSSVNDECRIDALPQTWAVISGAGTPARTRQAMNSLLEHLVKWDDRLVLLFDPPFDTGKLQPGYIKGYVPGIRENGGQYTHASTWVVMALAELGERDKAWKVFDLLNPIRHAATPADVARYKVEPYVVAADVYGRPPHTGRGGWTWYTGSASWLYRVGLESILGFHKFGDRLEIRPCVPESWKSFEIFYSYGSAKYHIKVEQSGATPGVWVDGVAQPSGGITLVDDGHEHQVKVETGPGQKD